MKNVHSLYNLEDKINEKNKSILYSPEMLLNYSTSCLKIEYLELSNINFEIYVRKIGESAFEQKT